VDELTAVKRQINEQSVTSIHPYIHPYIHTCSFIYIDMNETYFYLVMGPPQKYDDPEEYGKK
jgi:hypothetical protein